MCLEGSVMSGDGRTGRDRSRSRPRLRGRRGGNPWRASQVARYDRGVSSAIDFASPAELARSPPRASSARRPEPPPGPPPGYSEESGSWQWVWSWVPDRQPRDVRDGPSTSSAAHSGSREERDRGRRGSAGEGRASDPVHASFRRGPGASRASVADRPEAKAKATTPKLPSTPKAPPAKASGSADRASVVSPKAVAAPKTPPKAPAASRARDSGISSGPQSAAPGTRERREVTTPTSITTAAREDRDRSSRPSAPLRTSTEIRAERVEGSRHPASAETSATISGTRAVREASSTASLTSRSTTSAPARSAGATGASRTSEAKAAAVRLAEPKAPPSTRASPSPVSTIERPLIVLDWHHTLSFESDRGSYVPERVRFTLRRAQSLGYDLGICSFASAPETQTRVLREARDLQPGLIRDFLFINICNRKFLDDAQRRPSISGLRTCKAEEICRVGAAVYVDDQRRILQEVEDLQRGRAAGNRCRTLISHCSRPSAALEELERLLSDESPEDHPPPSVLRALR